MPNQSGVVNDSVAVTDVATTEVKNTHPKCVPSNYAVTHDSKSNFVGDSAGLAEQNASPHLALMKRCRSIPYAGQVSQRERILSRSRVDLKAGEVGDNVAVFSPVVGRGRGDRARNILGFITARDLDRDLYRIVVVKAGI